MKLGKIPENVLKRSILKKLDVKRNDTSETTNFGEYCAFLSCDNGCMVFSSETSADDAVNKDHFLFDRLINSLAVKNAKAMGIMVSLTVPEYFSEQELKDKVETLSLAAKEKGIRILDVNTKVSEAVKAPIVSATVIGKTDDRFYNKACLGDDVVVSKWVGLEGTHLIAKLKEQELLKKFPSHLIYDAVNYDKFISIIPEAATAIKSGVTAMYSLSEGGIFAGLWELAGTCGVGLEIVLRDIPLKQETVEICNQYDLNPYELLSGGSLLMTTPDGNGLIMELNKIGIEAKVIGKCTDSNDKVLINDEIRRFIEPAKQDEIYKILQA